MEKPLNEMSNEELWQLFPIVISEYKDQWPEYYKEEEQILKKILGKDIVSINHIGSTAVPYLPAKPTIDILIEIKENADIEVIIKDMEANNYIYSYQPNKPKPHMMFMKGYILHGFGERVFHIHIRYQGDWDEIYFRNYLINHAETAKDYAKLKVRLSKLYKHDRDAYTLAKTNFIKQVTEKARRESNQ